MNHKLMQKYNVPLFFKQQQTPQTLFITFRFELIYYEMTLEHIKISEGDPVQLMAWNTYLLRLDNELNKLNEIEKRKSERGQREGKTKQRKQKKICPVYEDSHTMNNMNNKMKNNRTTRFSKKRIIFLQGNKEHLFSLFFPMELLLLSQATQRAEGILHAIDLPIDILDI